MENKGKKFQEAVEKTLKKFDKEEYDKLYNKEKVKHYHLSINAKYKDVIEWLDKQGNKNGYIIQLIKDDMAKKQLNK